VGVGVSWVGVASQAPSGANTSQHKPTPQPATRIPVGHMSGAQKEFSLQAVVLACVGLCGSGRGL
jgi:hypothetical protein